MGRTAPRAGSPAPSSRCGRAGPAPKSPDRASRPRSRRRPLALASLETVQPFVIGADREALVVDEGMLVAAVLDSGGDPLVLVALDRNEAHAVAGLKRARLDLKAFSRCRRSQIGIGERAK